MQQQKRIQKYQFSLKRLLGQGSYASVYRGKVIETSQPVAVKVIDKRIFTSSFNLKNLHSQIDIMKKVNHQNIVKLYDVFQTSNNMYIVTQLCDFDLYGYLKEKRKLPEEEAIGFLKQIMKGIKYLNSHNIIHRDLKPANILLKGQQCKISDFGFAKNVDSQNVFHKSIVGTPLYMSPQLLQKQKYTNKSDLWSVGLIFYQMLHGKTPWMANNELQLINAIHTQKIQYSKLISEGSKDFIMKCLTIKEEDRMGWEQAFQHHLVAEGNGKEGNMKEGRPSISIGKNNKKKSIVENKSSMLAKQFLKQLDTPLTSDQNNSNVLNFNQTMLRAQLRKQSCLTPKMSKNVSEIKLKKVQALTPKANFSNINNKLKQVWALNNQNQSMVKKNVEEKRKKRNLTANFECKQSER